MMNWTMSETMKMSDIIVCYIDYRPLHSIGEWKTMLNDFTGKPSRHSCDEQRHMMALVRGVKPNFEYRLREELEDEAEDGN